MTDRWKHRRLMAWIAFIASIIFPFLMSPLNIPDIVVIPFYSFTGTVLAVFIGGAVFDDNNMRKGGE